MKPIILETVDLSLSFGRKQVLKGITVQFLKGESVLIAGKNGSGKSTFLRCLAGILLPDHGRIVCDPGLDKHRIGFISDSLSFYEELSVAQGIDLHRRIYRLDSVPDDLLRKVGIDLAQKISSLSLGERAIFHLTITLAQKPLLLMIDEIIHHMDAYTRELLIDALIESVAALQTTVLLINHTFHDVERIPDRVLLMKDGVFIVDEKTDLLQQRIKKMVLKEPLQVDLPVLFSRDSGYFKEYYLYPFAEEMRTKVDTPLQDLALPEILKAFIGGSYEQKPFELAKQGRKSC